ncbi:MAG: YitT family protein [Acholeplasmataceae bacterium]
MRTFLNKTRRIELAEITVGVIIMTLGFYLFLLPQNLVVGGVMGIAVLVQKWIDVDVFYLVANIILLFVGLIFLGKKFFINTIYAAMLSPVLVFILARTIDNDIIMKHMQESPYLVSSVFGGISIGLGLALVIRNNSTTGGVDIIQKILHKYLKIPFSTALYIIDGIVILLAMIVDLQAGFYAIGSMLLAGLFIDRLAIEGKSGYTLFIITDHADRFKDSIIGKLDRSFTRIKVLGGYTNQEKDMIVVTLTMRELYQFKLMVKEADPNAFVFVTKTNEALGEGFTRGFERWIQKS